MSLSITAESFDSDDARRLVADLDAGLAEIYPPAQRFGPNLKPEHLKADHGKWSLQEDKRILEKQLLPAFGSGLPVRQLSAEKIAAYEEQRITTVSAWTVRNELTVLCHMLRWRSGSGTTWTGCRRSSCRRRRGEERGI